MVEPFEDDMYRQILDFGMDISPKKDKSEWAIDSEFVPYFTQSKKSQEHIERFMREKNVSVLLLLGHDVIIEVRKDKNYLPISKSYEFFEQDNPRYSGIISSCAATA